MQICTMALFKVEDIIDGNTIKVDGWSWSGNTGKKVRIAGLTFKDQTHNNFAKSKLQTLLIGKSVELRGAIDILNDNPKDNIVVCSIYLNDIDITQYFPELTT